MTHPSDTRVVGRSDRIALRLVEHSAELTNLERFTVFTYAFLHEKSRTFRVYFDEDGDNKQGQKQHNKT